MNNETVILQEILNSINILEDQQSFDFHVINFFYLYMHKISSNPYITECI